MSGARHEPDLAEQVSGEFVGPVWTVRSPQPRFDSWCTSWGAYDVPRLWDSVRREVDPAAWAQVGGFENLAQLLAEHHDRLVRLRITLSGGWDPDRNPAAAKYFAFVDELLYAMAEDSVAHASTARGLDRILGALAGAKEKLSPMKDEWDSVTTDFWPEWWDSAADELNARARQVMVEADDAVKDHRRQVVIPQVYAYPMEIADITVPPPPARTTPGGPHVAGPPSTTVPSAPTAPPPVPGHDPVLGGGPELDGIPGVPTPVPAVPGTPVSMLPVPPGSPYAPSGGAYILPGPGVGRGGWIHPMPAPSGQPGMGPAGPRAVGAAGGQGMAAMPTPMGTRPGRGPAGGDGRRRGGGYIWDVAQGVPPVIGQSANVDGPPNPSEEDRFANWFADLATPWADDLNVTIRRRSEDPS